MNIITVPISKVVPWDKNPRGILKQNFERLKKQIQKLGVYKPLVVCQENETYIVLGGNMRIRALKELEIQEVDVSIVDAPTDLEKLKYSLSDNDRAGYYEEDHLAELVYPHIDDLQLEDYHVDLLRTVSLKEIIHSVGPGGSDHADLDKEVEESAGIADTTVELMVPASVETRVREWLANGEPDTAAGRGIGVMKRCGLL
jgi:ParB-like chromosome segregation protein Spo0J